MLVWDQKKKLRQKNEGGNKHERNKLRTGRLEAIYKRGTLKIWANFWIASFCHAF